VLEEEVENVIQLQVLVERDVDVDDVLHRQDLLLALDEI
jgi:hypothetical protein